MKRGKEESGIVDIVVMVAAVCLAVIILGLIFPVSRQFAIVFGSVVCAVLVAAGIAVALRVAWVMARHGLRRH